MLRVVGSDPGTSSLDLLLLDDGAVADQVRLVPAQLRDDPGHPHAAARTMVADRPDRRTLGLRTPAGPRRRLDGRPPRADVAGPTRRARERLGSRRLPGLGPSLRPLAACRWSSCRAGCISRRSPRIARSGSVDVGTADKVAVAALALWFDAIERGGFDRSTFAVVEIGTAFSAILVVDRGRLVDASAGTRGPIGLRSGGSWDGELAYWRSPLSKEDLFRGGLADLGAIGPDAFRESLLKHTAGLQAVTPFERIYLSGRGLEQPEIMRLTTEALARFGELIPLPCLPGAWVKHAAQGSAILADALAGGRYRSLAESLQIASASGSVWDAYRRPDAQCGKLDKDVISMVTPVGHGGQFLDCHS